MCKLSRKFLQAAAFWPPALFSEVVLVQVSAAGEASTMRQFPACPYLPSPPDLMDASALSAHGAVRDDAFYLTALTYGHYLWLRGLASRAMLKLDRALCADLRGLAQMAPSLRRRGVVSQAYSGRRICRKSTGPLSTSGRSHEGAAPREQRRWRIWACWSLCRAVLPHLPGDPKHVVEEPAIERIVVELQIHGVPGELKTWRAALKAASRERSALVH